MFKTLWTGLLILSAMVCSSVASAQKRPSDIDAFVTVSKDGHLQLNGKRVRFWGATGGFSLGAEGADRQSYADVDLVVKRLFELGFNLVRDGHRGAETYTKGDRSEADLSDYFHFKFKQAGGKIWSTDLSHGARSAGSKDVDILPDAKTKEAWVAAMQEWEKKSDNRPVSLTRNVARIWDSRLEAIGIANMKRAVTQVNPYTGLKRADDPVYAIWELSNEEGWISQMTGGEWQQLPRFFQDELIGRWQEFVRAKYKDDYGVKKAWGFLLAGEALKDNTLLLAPIQSKSLPVVISDANPAAVAMLQASKQKYSRDDFNRARASDVLEFLTGLWVEHKKREADALKPLGKSLTKTPLVWNTGFPGSNIQAQFLQQHADAIAHDSYIGGTHHDATHRRFPFFSGLEELPRIAWKEPWIEHNHMPGKPYLIYETQIDNTGKYRAEFPMRMASLGAIQDWDVVCWHYYGFAPDSRKDKPFLSKLDTGHSMNLHYQFDEVQLSSMKAASAIFRNFLLKPAPKPTLFVFGKRSLFDPASMESENSYTPGMLDRMMATAYRYGSRLLIDPTLESRPFDPIFKEKGSFDRFLEQGYLIVGPSYRPRTFEPNPITPNDQIEYDWQKGHLKFDAPGVASYSGFFAQYGNILRFKNGVVLRDVTVKNDDGIAYPVTADEKFIEFSLVSLDQAPLSTTKHAVLSLVSTSFNSGFKFDMSKLYEFFAPKVENQGELPVLYARAGATIFAPGLKGMKYRFVGWDQKALGAGLITDGVLKVPADKAIFYVELLR